MRRFALFVLLVSFLAVPALALSGSASAQSDATLQERMTAAQFQAAGLHKLSAEELAQLDAYLQGQRAAIIQDVKQQNVGFANPFAGDRDAVVTRIVGEFTGWRSGTVFTLDNGQVWKLVDGSRLSGVRIMNPVVTIEPGMLGAWHLKIEGYNKRAQVKRIK